MLRQWKEFELGPGGPVTDMHVTLSEDGEILLGATTVKRFGKHDAVVLLYDEVNASIGLLPSNPRNKNAYPLKQKGRNQYRLVQASRFCRHHNIRVPRRIKFNTPELDPEGILILDLKKTTTIGRLAKHKARI